MNKTETPGYIPFLIFVKFPCGGLKIATVSTVGQLEASRRILRLVRSSIPTQKEKTIAVEHGRLFICGNNEAGQVRKVKLNNSMYATFSISPAINVPFSSNNGFLQSLKTTSSLNFLRAAVKILKLPLFSPSSHPQALDAPNTAAAINTRPSPAPISTMRRPSRSVALKMLSMPLGPILPLTPQPPHEPLTPSLACLKMRLTRRRRHNT